MKVAICGNGPLGIRVGNELHSLGAQVRIFGRNPKEDNPQGLFKLAEVTQIHKCFLAPKETITGSSRLADLFRVTYQVPDQPFTHYEDFDIVIDARGTKDFPKTLSASEALAVGEEREDIQDFLHYGLLSEKTFAETIGESKKVLLVGAGSSLGKSLGFFDDWIFQSGDHQLNLVSHLSDPLSLCSSDQKVQKILEQESIQLEQAIENYKKECEHYDGLESYIKVKHSKPIPPTGRISKFFNHNIVSLDRLEDREGLFVTIEGAPFRLGYEDMQLKTLHVDKVICANGFKRENSILKGLKINPYFSTIHPEPGFYQLGHEDFHPNQLELGLEQIPVIIENIKSFFKRA